MAGRRLRTGGGGAVDSGSNRSWGARGGPDRADCAAGCYPQQFDGGRRVDSAQLLALVAALKGRTVAVVGDVVADEFVYGRVARVSREAPVLILEYDTTEIVPGGAGNAANNVAALGGRPALGALVGRDDPARRVLDALPRRVDHTPRRR